MSTWTYNTDGQLVNLANFSIIAVAKDLPGLGEQTTETARVIAYANASLHGSQVLFIGSTNDCERVMEQIKYSLRPFEFRV